METRNDHNLSVCATLLHLPLQDLNQVLETNGRGHFSFYFEADVSCIPCAYHRTSIHLCSENLEVEATTNRKSVTECVIVLGTDSDQVRQRRTFCGHILTTNETSLVSLDSKD